MIVQQMVLLEKQDVANLKNGTTLTINIGGAEVSLGYAGASKKLRGPYNKKGNGHAGDEDDDEREERLGPTIQKIPCEVCGKSYDPRGLHIHMGAAHPKYARKKPDHAHVSYADKAAQMFPKDTPASQVGLNPGRTASGRHKKTKLKSKYLGVHWHSNGQRWRATYYDKEKKFSQYIKSSTDEKEAAQFYDAYMLKRFGDKAVLNFPKTK
jgi:hypothetical protein